MQLVLLLFAFPSKILSAGESSDEAHLSNGNTTADQFVSETNPPDFSPTSSLSDNEAIFTATTNQALVTEVSSDSTTSTQQLVFESVELDNEASSFESDELDNEASFFEPDELDNEASFFESNELDNEDTVVSIVDLM